MALLTSLPYLLLWTCALLCGSSVTASKMCLECEEPEWIINWDKMIQPSFYPSGTLEITPFTDIDDILQSIGLIWRADNILESLGFMCLRYGPEVNKGIGMPILPLVCNPIVDALRNRQTLDVSTQYDDFTPKSPDLDYEMNYFHLLEACDVAGRCQNCSLLEKLNFMGDCVPEGGIFPFGFVYNLVQRWAPLVFDLLEWLGPPRINVLDIYHTCSALRYITGMNTSALSHNVINVATYVGAEYIQHLFINSSCPLIDGNYSLFDTYNVRVLQAAYNATGRSFCSEIEGVELIEEFRNITKDAIQILVEVLTSVNYCKYKLAQEMSPLNESTIDLFCDSLDESLSHSGISPNNTGNSHILIVIDILREISRSYTVMDVAVTVCNISLMNPHLTNGSIGLMCRALIDGGPEELEDVCIQQKAVFIEFIYDFLDLDEPIGPSPNVTARPIDMPGIVFMGIEWVRVLFNLQDLSLATIIDVLDSLLHRLNIKTMLYAAIDVVLDGHFVMAFETMCLDSSNFRKGVEKYLSVQTVVNVILGQDLNQMVDLFTELFPLFVGVKNSDILCNNTSANVGKDGRPFQEYIEKIRMNVVNLFTTKNGCVYFMESLDEALSNAFNRPEDFLNSVLNSSTGFSDYTRMCTTVTFYLEPICYDFIVKMQPVLAQSERKIMVDLNFPYCYGSYWTYERGQFTGTGRTLPKLDLTILDPSPAFKYLDILPDPSDPLDHVGVYVHTYRSNFNNEEVSVHSLIQSNGIITFEIPTQTAYVGEDIVIRIPTPDKNRRRRLRWRKDGRLIDQGNGKNRLLLENVDPADAGIYEIYVSTRRAKGYHGILRLIVPACPRNYYNAPSCNKLAFVSCYNGGVLRTDTSDEQCICAYPFGGQFCHEVALPYPGEELPVDYCLGRKCIGVMFCRRDPFGCKCASGYTGKGCMKVCPQGRYGPSCEGTCHCQGDCDPVTGQCDVMCEVGMSGWNCQFPQPKA